MSKLKHIMSLLASLVEQGCAQVDFKEVDKTKVENFAQTEDPHCQQ